MLMTALAIAAGVSLISTANANNQPPPVAHGPPAPPSHDITADKQKLEQDKAALVQSEDQERKDGAAEKAAHDALRRDREDIRRLHQAVRTDERDVRRDEHH